MEKEKIPWYGEKSGYFGPDFLEVYASNITHDWTKKIVDFLERSLCLKPGMKILDLACGHGRHTIEFARRGYNMTGQDINSYFLKIAKQSAKEANVNIQWIQQDIRDIPFENEFDMVFNISAFGYLEDDEDDQRIIDQVAKALKFNGKFVIDIINREAIIRFYKEKDWHELSDGTKILCGRKFDLVSGHNREKLIKVSKGGREETLFVTTRQYTLVELIKMCNKSGLQFTKAYGNYNEEELMINSKRCILISQKTK